MNPEQLKAHIDTTMSNLQSTLATQQAEITKFGETSTATATKIAAMEGDLERLGNDLKEAVRKAAGGGIGENERGNVTSLGERFISSEEYKNMVENKSRASVPFMVGKLDPRSRFALTSEGTNGVGVASPPQRVPGFINPTQPAFTMRDLIPTQNTTQGSIEYVRTTGFFPVVTYLTADTTIGATSVPIVSSAGLSVGQPVLVGTEVRAVVTVPDATHITVAPLSSAHVAANQATRVVSRVISAVGQGQLKPTGEFTNFTLETESVKTIPTTVDVARQALDDVQQLRAFIDNQLMFEMGYTEEYNLLYGTGSSAQLRGILTDADRQVYMWSEGKTQTIGTEEIADTKIDCLRRAITLVQLARYPADGIVINPRDWEDVELMKGSDGHYLWININDGGAQRFFQYPVVVTDAILQGQALTGSFKLGTTLWDREQANIRISEHHADNFKRNLISLLAEERLAQTIYRPEAFVDVRFDSPPA